MAALPLDLRASACFFCSSVGAEVDVVGPEVEEEEEEGAAAGLAAGAAFFSFS